MDPFEPENLKLAHYRLRPKLLWRPGPQRPDGSHTRSFVHDFADGPYEFQPNEYLVVTPVEHITIVGDLVGEVLPASTLVEQCFSLTAGKLDPGYGRIGNRVQDFIMGLKNLLDEPNTFYPDRGIANISFIDFRSSPVAPTSWSPADMSIYGSRERLIRAADDGVLYPNEDT